MKSELRENMYVRTEKGIAKIKKIFPDGSEPYFEAKYETDTYLEIYYDSEYVSEYDVLKASYNIIDILEEGDYVNGVIVTQSYIDNIKHIAPEIKESNYGIKSIVTKEQFENCMYKIGGEIK